MWRSCLGTFVWVNRDLKVLSGHTDSRFQQSELFHCCKMVARDCKHTKSMLPLLCKIKFCLTKEICKNIPHTKCARTGPFSHAKIGPVRAKFQKRSCPGKLFFLLHQRHGVLRNNQWCTPSNCQQNVNVLALSKLGTLNTPLVPTYMCTTAIWEEKDTCDELFQPSWKVLKMCAALRYTCGTEDISPEISALDRRIKSGFRNSLFVSANGWALRAD